MVGSMRSARLQVTCWGRGPGGALLCLSCLVGVPGAQLSSAAQPALMAQRQELMAGFIAAATLRYRSLVFNGASRALWLPCPLAVAGGVGAGRGCPCPTDQYGLTWF